MSSSLPTALITGASTGIGFVSAERLARLGYRVLAGVRTAADASRVEAAGDGRIRALQLDVTRPEEVEAAREAVAAEVGDRGLDILVNNAGIAAAGPLEFLPLEVFRRVQEVNVVGLLGVTQAFLPMIRTARGRIINIGSISGLVANPFVGAYAASKHALEGLTDSLRVELAPWGIEVILIEPGVIQTPIWSKSEADAMAMQAEFPPEAVHLYGRSMEAMRRILLPAVARASPAEVVADAVQDAALSPEPRTRYVVGKQARLRVLLGTLLPDRMRDRMMLAVLRRFGERRP